MDAEQISYLTTVSIDCVSYKKKSKTLKGKNTWDSNKIRWLKGFLNRRQFAKQKKEKRKSLCGGVSKHTWL